MELIEKLNWRYATKRMNGTKVPKEKLDRILHATRLAASSFGLQPFSVLVVEDMEVRKKLQPLAFGQPQIVEASHLLVFAAWDNVTEQRIDNYIQDVATTRNAPLEALAGFKGYMSSLLKNTPEHNFNWAARQAYIALGTALAAAATEDVDSTPMEGFSPDGFDEVLGLKAKGLKSVVILALGYRDAEQDQLSKAPKVRRAHDKFFIHI